MGTTLSASELASRQFIPGWLSVWGKRMFVSRPSPQYIERIVCIKSGAIGDVILTTPLLRALREKFPHARIDYITSSYASVALLKNPHISHVITIPDAWWNWQSQWRLGMRLFALRKAQYDIVFVLDRAWQAGLVGRFLGEYTIGFDRLGEGFALDAAVPYGYEAHEEAPHDVITYLALGEHVGALSQNARPVLVPDKTQLPLTTKKRVVLAPGGARNIWQDMPQRRWPLTFYIVLAKRLIAAGYEVVVLGNTDDAIEGRILEKAMGSQRILNYVGKTNLAQTASLLTQADIAVLHDSALLHIASATNTPTVALFGPTNPARKGPISKFQRTLSAMRFCSDCGRVPCVWESRVPRCKPGAIMGEISVDRVFGAVEDLLNEVEKASP